MHRTIFKPPRPPVGSTAPGGLRAFIDASKRSERMVAAAGSGPHSVSDTHTPGLLSPLSRSASLPSPCTKPSLIEPMETLSWSHFFSTRSDVVLPSGDRFSVYKRSSADMRSSEHAGTGSLNAGADAAGPPTEVSEGPAVAIFALHGAGHSAMSWANVALRTTLLLAGQQPAGAPGAVDFYAMDMRGHGKSAATSQEAEGNLSAEQLVSDVCGVLASLFGAASATRTSSADGHRLVICGHSMGGAVAIRVVHALQASPLLGLTVVGLVVMDVVEGTAISALPAMTQVIARMPQSFGSVQDAVQWSLQSSTQRNADSACVSVPYLLVENTTTRPHFFQWRTNLSKTEPFWRGWFEGISSLFLQVQVPKLLLLAGTDRLDTALTVAQMQGKFQLVVLPAVGHLVHEDAPEATAEALASFVRRHLLARRR